MLERVPAWFVADSSPIVPHRFMETSRLEIFADGVFAIAATLLVVRVSVNAPGAATLIALWSPYTTLAIITALALFIRKQSPGLARKAGCVRVRKRGDRRRSL